MATISRDTIREALTFDDVLLEPGYSEVLPAEVDVSSRLTRGIGLKCPLLSAAMDTVTEAETAIGMARMGGIGIVHKNLSIEQQAREIRKVKKSETGMVADPLTINPGSTLRAALELMETHGFSGLPVVENPGQPGPPVGILTSRDIRFETNLDQKVNDVMTKKVITAPQGIDPDEAKSILHQHRIEKLLVVDDRGHLLGLITVKDILKSDSSPNANKDGSGRLRVGAAVGTSADTMERVAALVAEDCDVIIVDTAHGHSSRVLDTIRAVRGEFPDLQIVGGNIATPAAFEALVEAGVDGVKVGIGPGSICTTRVVAGVGVPQVSAIMDVAEVSRKTDVPIIADGGIKYSGDVVKALAAGANSVMIGSLLAGTDEAPGELVLYQGRSYKVYRGMGSIGAMKAGSKDRYFQSTVAEERKLVPEGIEGRVPYRGRLADSLFQLLGGLRSGMGYVGAPTIPQLAERATFRRISSQGLRESHVHDVIITKEAPNYRME
ncbi:inosine-5'-monophosphate dehydrogenase [Plesiocystis pacifica SIR-1]|uniref:Inosine-5'-monophosphate dehydrogenase n=1 Tax=Plesiocystis pacifica SIR-1 TaxID=391625 RepID=A6GKQ6_9BACT|nr:IMP dehydrogenase [Plesiocystis pacifica]EDM73548.1 inosine-5'-monophosphate dehydrogenase [Plesiocystis pacifica SIR-1]